MQNSKHTLDINRRQFLTQMTKCFGAAAAASIVSSVSVSTALAYVPKKHSEQQDGVLFNRMQMQMLRAISDLILPKTDTPSGGELDCHGFVDHQLMHCHGADQQAAAKAILKSIDAVSVAQFSASFNQLQVSQKLTILEAVESEQGFSGQQKNQFKLLKWLIVFGYFTSEIGATKALNYQAVPGGFKGSIPADESTLSWGSVSYL